MYSNYPLLSIVNIILIMQHLLDCYTIPSGGGQMVADRIKTLREQEHMTQSQLAKQLGITRSSVNTWELGISVPSTQYIVELANIFHVSTDYLLGVNSTASISVAGLSDSDIDLICHIIMHLKNKA